MCRAVVIILTSLLLPALSCFPIEAREGSARLVFQMTAVPPGTTVYVVKI